MKLVPSSHTFSRAASAGIVSMLALSIIGSAVAPTAAFAASNSSSSNSIQISGWIPYWATAKGTADADAHLSQTTEINPFGYSVKSDGTLSDTMNLSDPAWQNLFKDARAKGVKIVPTVMWSDTAGIYNILSNPTLRATHVQSIVNAVKQGGFDGIDIDYEGKSAETRDAYSAFLTELSAALYKSDKNDVLDCTIEARMPLEARYAGTPPANIEYANDLPTINKVCDRVRLMTYDQQTADLQLNAAHSKELYAPVADTAWVQKVVDYMDTDINRSKIMIGVATYGAEWQAMSNPNGSGFTYTKTSSFNPQYALDVAKQYNITPSRNASGELYISYVDKNQPAVLPSNDVLSSLAPSGTDSGYLAAAGALAYSKKTSKQAPVTFLTWSDAQAIQDKAKLAEKLGVAGIAIFKFDGGEDPNMWNAIASVASPAPATQVTRSTAGGTTTSSGTTGTVVTGATGSVTIPVGCQPGFAFSTQTGERCPVTTTPIVPPVTTVTPSAPVVPVTTPTTPSTAPSATTAAFTKDLQFNDSGTDVTRLQKILIAKGYMKVAANGNFGPATKAALTAWQKAAGLPATGYFGPLSRAAIVK
jgi:spore germination protein YaaH